MPRKECFSPCKKMLFKILLHCAINQFFFRSENLRKRKGVDNGGMDIEMPKQIEEE